MESRAALAANALTSRSRAGLAGLLSDQTSGQPADVNLALLDPHMKRRLRSGGRTTANGTGAQREAGTVAAADDLVPLE